MQCAEKSWIGSPLGMPSPETMTLGLSSPGLSWACWPLLGLPLVWVRWHYAKLPRMVSSEVPPAWILCSEMLSIGVLWSELLLPELLLAQALLSGILAPATG